MNTIVVGTDTSSAADLAVEGAARLARESGSELLVLYVRPDGDLRAVGRGHGAVLAGGEGLGAAEGRHGGPGWFAADPPVHASSNAMLCPRFRL